MRLLKVVTLFATTALAGPTPANAGPQLEPRDQATLDALQDSARKVNEDIQSKVKTLIAFANALAPQIGMPEAYVPLHSVILAMEEVNDGFVRFNAVRYQG